MKATLKTTLTDTQLKEILNALSLQDCKVAMNILKKRIEQEQERKLKKKTGNRKFDDDFLNLSVQEFELSPRILNRLKEHEMNTVRDIADIGIDRLKIFRGIGERSAEEIQREIFQD